MEEHLIRDKFTDISQNLLAKFDKLTKEIGEIGDIIELRNELVEKMEKDFSERLQLNDESSQDLCKKLINEIFNSFNFSSIITLDNFKV